MIRFSGKAETKRPPKAFGARPAGDGSLGYASETRHLPGMVSERSVGLQYVTSGHRNGLDQTLNAQTENALSTSTMGALGTGKAIKTHVLSAAEQLLAQAATRFYVQWFVTITIVQFGLAAILMHFLATPAFSYACYFGMAFPAATSFISFLLTEWAFEQPTLIFMAVAMTSMVVRMFNLLLVFAIGLIVIKFSMFGLLVGLLGSFLSYMVIEIMYIHNKGSLLGH